MEDISVSDKLKEKSGKKRLSNIAYQRHFKLVFSGIIIINVILILLFLFLRSDMYRLSKTVIVNSSQNTNDSVDFPVIKTSKLVLEKGRVLITNDCDYESKFICKLYIQNRDGNNKVDLLSVFDYSKGDAAGNFEGLKLEGNVGKNLVYSETYYAKKSSDNQPIYKNTLGYINLVNGKKTLIENLTQWSDSKKQNEVGEKGVIIQIIPIEERNSVVYSLSEDDKYYIKEYNFDTKETKIVVDSSKLQPEPNFYNNLLEVNEESDASRQRTVYLLPPPVVIHQLGKDIIVLKLITGGIGKTKRIDLATGKYFDYSFIPNKLSNIVSNGEKIAYTYINSSGYEVLEVVEARDNKRLVIYKRLSADNLGIIKFGFMGNILLFQESPGKIFAWNSNLYSSSSQSDFDSINEQFYEESQNYRKNNNNLDNLFILSRNVYNGSFSQDKHTLAKLVFENRNKTFKIEESKAFSTTAKDSMLIKW